MSDPAEYPPLTLASRSPRRLKMLREAGFAVRQIDPPFADPADPSGNGLEDVRAVALTLAGQKLESFLGVSTKYGVAEDAIILAADTVGQTPAGQLIGTPETETQALAMLLGLVDASHTIASAAVWSRVGKREAAADRATVHLGQISKRDLQAYIDTGAWQGKAGGYNLEDRQQAGWPIRVEGDPCTVMGLPMQMLKARLGAGQEFRQPEHQPG